MFFLKLLKSYRCYQLRWIWDLQMFTIVLYQASHLRTGHLRPKMFKAEIWKGPSSKMMKNSQCSWDLWKLFGLPHSWSQFLWVWFYHRFGWCFRLYPQVSKIHWWLVLSFRKYVPFTLFCINSHAKNPSLQDAVWPLHTVTGAPIGTLTQWDWTGSYRRWWLFLIMNFGLTRFFA